MTGRERCGPDGIGFDDVEAAAESHDLDAGLASWSPRRSAARHGIDVATMLQRDGSRHQHVAVLAPHHVQVPARQRDSGVTPGEPAPGGRDQRGAGGRTAGERRPGTPFPNAQG